MIIGYARVSTDDQNLSLQIQALRNASCEIIYKDHGESGIDFGRRGLLNCLKRLKPGDTLVVWRLDRLGRSLARLIKLMDVLARRKVKFRSITENIDTGSSGGRLMFHMMAALAEFERAIISERTRAGMAAAKANGRQLGRPRALTTEQARAARWAIEYGNETRKRIALEFSVSPRTLQRHLDSLAEREAIGPVSAAGAVSANGQSKRVGKG